jgi:hypothetical protein
MLLTDVCDFDKPKNFFLLPQSSGWIFCCAHGKPPVNVKVDVPALRSAQGTIAHPADMSLPAAEETAGAAAWPSVDFFDTTMLSSIRTPPLGCADIIA